jgi:glycine cleavage system H protein
MDNFSFLDIFATKGVEYLFVIGYLVFLIGFWALMRKFKEKEESKREPVS